MSADADSGADLGGDVGGAEVVTVLDRFPAVGIPREAFDAHLIGGRTAVAGERITDPATPAPLPTAVAIMVDPE